VSPGFSERAGLGSDIQPIVITVAATILGSIELTSGVGVVISIIVLGGLFVLWIFSLFLIVTDSISVLGKIVWAILVTCIAPLAIPVYLILHHHRQARA
jgi:hypothetical protein